LRPYRHALKDGILGRKARDGMKHGGKLIVPRGQVAGAGDLTIEWDAANHEVMIGQIQALIDRGVAFYNLAKTVVSARRQSHIRSPGPGTSRNESS
jgi:hypothetical protein